MARSKLKPKQEKLAQALASGATLAEASKKAGYSGDKTSACVIAKDPNVSQRITELRAKAEDAMECNRLNYIRVIHSRFINEEHPHAPKYAELLGKAQGWFEPDKVELNGELDIIVRIGGKTPDHN